MNELSWKGTVMEESSALLHISGGPRVIKNLDVQKYRYAMQLEFVKKLTAGSD